MSTTVEFVARLLHDGEAVFRAKPEFPREDRDDLLRLLETAHLQYRLSIAGPLLPFAAEAALAAARFVTMACWALVGEDRPDLIGKYLDFPIEPDGPESHLSGDLTLRYLSTIYRRVRARPVGDLLHKRVVEVLCRWPLSGALVEINAPPAGDLSFGNHPGLQLLYAERLAVHPRPTWLPPEGRGLEAVELIMQQR